MHVHICITIMLRRLGTHTQTYTHSLYLPLSLYDFVVRACMHRQHSVAVCSCDTCVLIRTRSSAPHRVICTISLSKRFEQKPCYPHIFYLIFKTFFLWENIAISLQKLPKSEFCHFHILMNELIKLIRWIHWCCSFYHHIPKNVCHICVEKCQTWQVTHTRTHKMIIT